METGNPFGFLLHLLPSGEQMVGGMSFENYKFVVIASAITISVVAGLIVYLIKSRQIRLPILTELGMFFIAGAMIAVADGLFADYGGDPIAIAMRWLFLCTGVLFVVVSGTLCYMELNRKIKKKGQRNSDMMPLYHPEMGDDDSTEQSSSDKKMKNAPKFKFRDPKGIHGPEDWHG